MRYLQIAACFFSLLVLCSCVADTNEPTKREKVSAESVRAEQLLHLNSSQNCEILDFDNDKALAAVYETGQVNQNDTNDQLSTYYYDYFSIVDFAKQEETSRVAIERFGICTSALMVYNGILCSFYSNESDLGETVSFLFLHDNKVQNVFSEKYSILPMGPVLQRYGNDILFSYHTYGNEIKFGINRINPSFVVDSILSFSSSNSDFLTDEFETFGTRFVYAVGENDCVTFYVGSMNQPNLKIQLKEGDRIYGFDITENELFISKECQTQAISKSYIEQYDLLSGNVIQRRDTSPPLYWIAISSTGKMCGVDSFASLRIFDIENTEIVPLEMGETHINGNYTRVLENSGVFLVPITNFDYESKKWQTEIWLISTNSSKNFGGLNSTKHN